MRREPVKLGEILKQVSRKIAVLDDTEYPELGLRAHGNGTFHKPPVNGSETTKDLYSVESGDLLLSVVFAWEGAVAVAGPADHGRFTSHRFPAFRCNPSLALEEYMALWLVHGPGRQLLVANSPGGAGRNKTLNKTALLACTARLPSVTEQRRAVDLLSSARDLVAALEAEVHASHAATNELVHHLVAGAPPALWSSIASVGTKTVAADPATQRLAGVRNGHKGLFIRSEPNEWKTAYADMQKITAGQTVIGKITAQDGGMAVAAPEHEGAVLSREFLVYDVDETRALPAYVGIAMRSHDVTAAIRKSAQGTGASMKRITAPKMSGVRVPLPDLTTQQRIVETVEVAKCRARTIESRLALAVETRSHLLRDILSGSHSIPESYDRFLTEVGS